MTSGPDALADAAAGHRAVFQPIVDLRSWRVIGFEALARFDDGRSPLDHLSEAEERGTRQELELRLIATALIASRTLPDEPLITLNASGPTVLAPEFGALLRAARRPWGLEIFEGATTASLVAIRATVTALGGRLLVDDAGAASADLDRVTDLRPDVVKIDRALFWRSATDPAARATLDALVEATRGLGSQVLVEGIEHADHVDLARDLGADLGQGFHLGRPTAGPDVATMLVDLHRRIGVDAPGL